MGPIYRALTFQWAFFSVRLLSRCKWYIIYIIYVGRHNFGSDGFFAMAFFVFSRRIMTGSPRVPRVSNSFVDTVPRLRGTRSRNFLSITFSYLIKFMEDGGTKILALVFFLIFENYIFLFLAFEFFCQILIGGGG